MNAHADQAQEKKSQSASSEESQEQNRGDSTFQFVNKRPEAVVQRKLQEMANNSPQTSQLRAFQDMANNSHAQLSSTNPKHAYITVLLRTLLSS